MRIVSFLERDPQNTVSYSYRHRGMEIGSLPDVMKEKTEREWYTQETGCLFCGQPVAWKNATVLNGGVDIWVRLGKSYFIDHVELCFGNGSGVESIEICTGSAGQERKIGVHRAETDRAVSEGTVQISVGVSCEELIVRLNGCCMPIVLERLAIWGVEDLKQTVWPLPEQAQFTGKAFPLSAIAGIDAVGEDAVFAGAYLRAILAQRYGVTLEEGPGKTRLSIEIIAGGEKDGFCLTTADTGCTITARNRRSLLYAVCALLQLTDGKTVQCAQIKDEAFLDMRGIHIALPPRNRIEFLKRLIRYVLVPMRYNTVFLQISGAMRYDRYPEINEKWVECCEKYEQGLWPKIHHYGFIGRDILEKDEVREICREMRQYGIEVIPEVQTWAHTQYITTAYPELAEQDPNKGQEETVDLNVRDKKPSDFYPHTMCPLHENYYSVIFGVMEEVLQVVQPERYVHVGHDEIYQTGLCPVCSQIPKADIFAQEVTEIHKYLTEKGLTMIMWADMLQFMDYSIPEAINRIPKDIVMFDFTWYFDMDTDTEERLLSYGFNVVLGNLYSSHYPRYETRAKKQGILGGEVSVWKPCDEKTYGYFGKMFDFVYTANMLWNRAYREELRRSYLEIIKGVLGQIRLDVGQLRTWGAKKWLELGGAAKLPPSDLWGVSEFEKALWVRNGETEVAANGKADVVTVVHATDTENGAAPNQRAVAMGAYTLCYEDGSCYTEDVRYGENIYRYRAPYGHREMSILYRHQGYVGTYLQLPVCGKTVDGGDYTLGAYSFRNPYPEKPIRAVKVQHFGNTNGWMLVFEIRMELQ